MRSLFEKFVFITDPEALALHYADTDQWDLVPTWDWERNELRMVELRGVHTYLTKQSQSSTLVATRDGCQLKSDGHDWMFFFDGKFGILPKQLDVVRLCFQLLCITIIPEYPHCELPGCKLGQGNTRRSLGADSDDGDEEWQTDVEDDQWANGTGLGRVPLNMATLESHSWGANPMSAGELSDAAKFYGDDKHAKCTVDSLRQPQNASMVAALQRNCKPYPNTSTMLKSPQDGARATLATVAGWGGFVDHVYKWISCRHRPCAEHNKAAAAEQTKERRAVNIAAAEEQQQLATAVRKQVFQQEQARLLELERLEQGLKRARPADVPYWYTYGKSCTGERWAVLAESWNPSESATCWVFRDGMKRKVNIPTMWHRPCIPAIQGVAVQTLTSTQSEP